MLAALLLAESVHAQTAELEAHINSAGGDVVLHGTWRLDEPVDIQAHGQRIWAHNATFVNPRVTPDLAAAHQGQREPAFRIHGSGLKFVAPTIDGPNDAQQASVGFGCGFWQNGREWDHGIQIVGASNIELVAPRIENPWGDGVAVWGDSFNVVIRPTNQAEAERIGRSARPYITGAGRNGVSFVQGRWLQVWGADIPHTPGLWAVDIEPDNNFDRLDEILVHANRIGASTFSGINLGGPYGVNDGAVNPFGHITITGNSVGANTYGFPCVAVEPDPPSYVERLELHSNSCAADTSTATTAAPTLADVTATPTPVCCKVSQVRSLTVRKTVRKLKRSPKLPED